MKSSSRNLKIQLYLENQLLNQLLFFFPDTITALQSKWQHASVRSVSNSHQHCYICAGVTPYPQHPFSISLYLISLWG